MIELSLSTNAITILGECSQGGTYVLGIRLFQPTQIAFGRFRGGRPLHFPEGDYLYVGSALGQTGSTTLARRLLRHATRSGTRPPHVIRQPLQHALLRTGLGPPTLRPPRQKRLFWHIDYFLDELQTQIVRVILLRSPRRLEGMIAALLERDAHTSVLAPGLGARDDPDRTHLLYLEIHLEDWWNQFIAQLVHLDFALAFPRRLMLCLGKESLENFE